MDAPGEPADPAGGGLLVQRAFAGRFVQGAHGLFEGFLGLFRGFGQSLPSHLDCIFDARLIGFVAKTPLFILATSFQGGFVIGQRKYPPLSLICDLLFQPSRRARRIRIGNVIQRAVSSKKIPLNPGRYV
jgi:hypothetical protein